MTKKCIICSKEFRALRSSKTCSKACSEERKKACQNAYYQKPEVKARKKACQNAYYQKPEVKARKKARSQTPEAKAKERARSQTPEAKAKERARYQTPEYKAKKRDKCKCGRMKIKTSKLCWFCCPFGIETKLTFPEIKEALKKKHFIKGGYWSVSFKGKTYKVHRLVYMLHHKRRIKKCYVIDHINAIKTDNRICNLREVTHGENVRAYHTEQKYNLQPDFFSEARL